MLPRPRKQRCGSTMTCTRDNNMKANRCSPHRHLSNADTIMGYSSMIDIEVISRLLECSIPRYMSGICKCNVSLIARFVQYIDPVAQIRGTMIYLTTGKTVHSKRPLLLPHRRQTTLTGESVAKSGMTVSRHHDCQDYRCYLLRKFGAYGHLLCAFDFRSQEN